MSSSDDFDIFNEIDLKEEDSDSSDLESEECTHPDVSNDNGIVSCTECGLELQKIISYEKDWRYYGSDDTRKNSDPNRCHIRKIEDKSIFKDVETFGFSEKVVNMANDIYTEVTKCKIYRGN